MRGYFDVDAILAEEEVRQKKMATLCLNRVRRGSACPSRSPPAALGWAAS
jgi:hypothetical protein